jgi:hypothetical protein
VEKLLLKQLKPQGLIGVGQMWSKKNKALVWGGAVRIPHIVKGANTAFGLGFLPNAGETAPSYYSGCEGLVNTKPQEPQPRKIDISRGSNVTPPGPELMDHVEDYIHPWIRQLPLADAKNVVADS